MSTVEKMPAKDKDTTEETVNTLEPPKWGVCVSHAGNACPSLLYGAFADVFHIPEPLAKIGAMLAMMTPPNTPVPLQSGLTQDVAESFAKKANDYIYGEQSVCICGSSIKFNATLEG